MNESSLRKKRNIIKAIGSGAAILGGIFSWDTHSLLTEGPGVLTGLLVLVMLSCVAYLVVTKG